MAPDPFDQYMDSLTAGERKKVLASGYEYKVPTQHADPRPVVRLQKGRTSTHLPNTAPLRAPQPRLEQRCPKLATCLAAALYLAMVSLSAALWLVMTALRALLWLAAKGHDALAPRRY